MLLHGENAESSLEYGITASKMTVESQGSESVICDEISLETVKKQLKRSRSEKVV